MSGTTIQSNHPSFNEFLKTCESKKTAFQIAHQNLDRLHTDISNANIDLCLGIGIAQKSQSELQKMHEQFNTSLQVLKKVSDDITAFNVQLEKWLRNRKSNSEATDEKFSDKYKAILDQEKINTVYDQINRLFNGMNNLMQFTYTSFSIFSKKIDAKHP